MNQKNMRMFIMLGVVVTSLTMYSSDRSCWKPWNSKDLHSDVMEGQLQLKAEQGKEFSEQGLMETEEACEKSCLQEVARLQAIQQLKLEQDAEKLEQNLMRHEEHFEQGRLEKQRFLQTLEAKKEKQRDKERVLALQAQLAEVEKETDARLEKLMLRKAMHQSQLESIALVEARKKELLNDQEAINNEIYRKLIACGLQAKSLLKSDIDRIMKGYESSFDMDIEIQSRELPSKGFFVGNDFWPIFFNDLVDVIEAHNTEVSCGVENSLLQDDIKGTFNGDNNNVKILDIYNDSILNVSVTAKKTVKDTLAKILDREKALLDILIRKKSPHVKITMNNYKILQSMSQFLNKNGSV